MRVFTLALTILALSACGTAQPPAHIPGNWRTIYVAGHGMHTGLIVRAGDVPAEAWPARADMPQAQYLELGWGDRQYYVREDAGVLLGSRALLWPTLSAIHVVGIAGPIRKAFPRSEIIELRVPVDGFARLVAFVAESHERDARGRAIVLAPGQRPGARFYASHRKFHLFETCNTWVARALREAGVSVDLPITAEGLLRQLRRGEMQ